MLKNKKNVGRGVGCCQINNEEIYNKNIKKCKYCNLDIPYKKRCNKFCNSSCAASFNNRGVIRNFTGGKWGEKKCLNCGAKTLNPKFCSTVCCTENRYKQTWNKIEVTGRITSHTGKKFLIHKKGHQCEICGNKEWLGKSILLIMDHIDGDSDNNLLSNLRLVCSNCDATLPTYKNRNKNNGRDSKRQEYRKNRYKNGSCN